MTNLISEAERQTREPSGYYLWCQQPNESAKIASH